MCAVFKKLMLLIIISLCTDPVNTSIYIDNRYDMPPINKSGQKKKEEGKKIIREQVGTP